MEIGPDLTDAELIRRAASDPGAFAELYTRHVVRVHRVVRSRVPAAFELGLVLADWSER